MKKSNQIFLVAMLILVMGINASKITAQQNVCAFNSSLPHAEFDARIDFAKIAVKWYPEWLEKHNGQEVLPSPVSPLEKW